MIEKRVIPKETLVHGMRCDGPDCSNFAELDSVARMPWGWLSLHIGGEAESPDFCSRACIAAWMYQSQLPGDPEPNTADDAE